MTIELIVDETRVEFKKKLILPILPERLTRGKFYKFDIEGYVIFPLGIVISLFEEGSSNPAASIEITQQTNYLLGGRYNTNGEFLVRVC